MRSFADDCDKPDRGCVHIHLRAAVLTWWLWMLSFRIFNQDQGHRSGEGMIPTPLSNLPSLHVCVKAPCLLGHWEFKCTFTAINPMLGIDHLQEFTTAVSSHHTQCISYEYLLRHSLATYLLAESSISFLFFTFVQSPPHFKLNFKLFKFNLVNYLFKAKIIVALQ